MRLGTLTAAAAIAGYLAFFAAGAARAQTALLMFEQEGCEWCERWNEDIGGFYHKTAEGRRAPLRRIDIGDPVPEGLELASRPAYTPTFVLIDDGRELGRIEGYPGEDFFWGLLGMLMKRLPAPGAEKPET
jgi:hypothetical protein